MPIDPIGSLRSTSRRYTAILAMVTSITGLLAASPARADAIDGDWCSSEGRHVAIKGPEIVIPSGKKLNGNYTRHSFSYIVPASEPGAGQTVAMQLLNEDAMTVRIAADAAALAQVPGQTWRRCAAPVS